MCFQGCQAPCRLLWILWHVLIPFKYPGSPACSLRNRCLHLSSERKWIIIAYFTDYIETQLKPLMFLNRYYSSAGYGLLFVSQSFFSLAFFFLLFQILLPLSRINLIEKHFPFPTQASFMLLFSTLLFHSLWHIYFILTTLLFTNLMMTSPFLNLY